MGKLVKTTVALQPDATTLRHGASDGAENTGRTRAAGPVGVCHLEPVQATGGHRGRLLPLRPGNYLFGSGTPEETAKRMARTLFVKMSFSLLLFKIAAMKK